MAVAFINPSLASRITVCRGKSEVSETYLAVIRKDRLGDTNLPLSNMVSVPRRGHEGEKNRMKILRLINAAMSGLPAEVSLAINVVFSAQC